MDKLCLHTDEQLVACGINPGLIRFSVGLEDVNDILEDIKAALKAVDAVEA